MDNLERVNTLITKVLSGKIYNGDRFQLKKDAEDNVNNMIKDQYNILIKNKPISDAQDYINSCKDYLKANESTLKRLKNNKYNFIVLKEDNYVFDLSFQSNNCYNPEFEEAAIVSSIFFEENILETIAANAFLKEIDIEEQTITKNFLEVYSKTIYIIITKRIYIVLLVVILVFTLLIYNFIDYKIFVSSNIQQDISLAIVGALISFLGFGVVFFQLSYDNLKRTYAYYAKDLLFKSLGSDFVAIFLITLISAIIASLFVEKHNLGLIDYSYQQIQDIAFNIALNSFFYFTVYIFHRAKTMIDYSLSPKEINKLVNNINNNDIDQLAGSYKNNSDTAIILESFENNTIEIINEIAYNLILQNNYRLSQLIIKDLTDYYIRIIEHNAKNSNFKETAYNIISIYVKTVNLISGASFKGDFDSLIISCYKSIESMNHILAIYKSDAETLIQLTSLTRSLIKDSVKYNKTYQLQIGIECYKNCAFEQIKYNTPQSFEVSGFFQQYVPKSGAKYIETTRFWQVLFTLTVRDFYLITQDSLDDIGKLDKISIIDILTYHTHYLNSIIDLSSIGKFQKNFIVGVLLDHVLGLHLDAFLKNRIDSSIQLRCPLNLRTVNTFLDIDEVIASKFENLCSKWVNFFLTDKKTKVM
jgi:hypothetical protein